MLHEDDIQYESTALNAFLALKRSILHLRSQPDLEIVCIDSVDTRRHLPRYIDISSCHPAPIRLRFNAALGLRVKI